MDNVRSLSEFNFENIENICFFNHFHNGDCLATKEFVREFITVFGNKKFKYLHTKNKKVLFDLPCEYVDLTKEPKLPHNERFIIKDNQLFVFHLNYTSRASLNL